MFGLRTNQFKLVPLILYGIYGLSYMDGDYLLSTCLIHE